MEGSVLYVNSIGSRKVYDALRQADIDDDGIVLLCELQRRHDALAEGSAATPIDAYLDSLRQVRVENLTPPQP